jgi:hypothetical protein
VSSPSRVDYREVDRAAQAVAGAPVHVVDPVPLDRDLVLDLVHFLHVLRVEVLTDPRGRRRADVARAVDGGDGDGLPARAGVRERRGRACDDELPEAGN